MKTNTDNQLIISIVRAANKIVKKRKQKVESKYFKLLILILKTGYVYMGYLKKKFLKYLKRFSEKEKFIKSLQILSELLNDEDKILKSVGIKSVAFIREDTGEDPMPPRLLVKKFDGTQYTIDGIEEISKHLTELFKNII